MEIEYAERNGKAVKLVTTYKQKKVTKKSNEHVERRKNWKPFGNCIDPTKYSDYGSNKPVRAEEEVKVELNKEKQMKALGTVSFLLFSFFLLLILYWNFYY